MCTRDLNFESNNLEHEGFSTDKQYTLNQISKWIRNVKCLEYKGIPLHSTIQREGKKRRKKKTVCWRQRMTSQPTVCWRRC
ncbi:hypothetical protein GIB67_001519 [Kingdonia uniflora]|uniref:Uncharacterized protein n=1 Tax=Kingdonia uniflora TaxID=39325 RepID=A0A7J7LZG5_9MAGN|nr:hypothetical protein GIB67_001519 [Kingdonia uniflora]